MSASAFPVVMADAARGPQRPVLRLAPAEAFVGRERELAALMAAVDAGARRIWISGASGVGKTELLAQLASRCREREIPYHWRSPHEPATPSVLGAITEELAQLPVGRRRRVLVIDGFEALRPIERWFVERLLPMLPSSVTVVVADRDAIPAWGRADDPGARIELRPLDDADARRYLELRGVADELRREILERAEGLPGLLVPAADAAGGWSRGGEPAPADGAVALYTRHDTDEHRLAIAVLVVARSTPYELLELAFDDSRAARDAFAWLSRLSVVDATPLGLRPHTLLRRACERELAAHAPGLWAQARRAVRVFVDHRVTMASEPARWLLDRLFVDRDHPAVRAHLNVPAGEPALAVVSAAPGHHAELLALASAYQGDQAAASVARWLCDDRAAFDVLCDGQGQVRGYLYTVMLSAASQGDAGDPAIDLCIASLRARGWFGLATSPDARVLVLRDWTVAGTHRAPSAGAALLLAQMACRLLTTPAVDFHFLLTCRPERWARALRGLGLAAQIAGEYHQDDVAITAIVTDWRWCSIPALLQNLSEIAAEHDAGQPRAVPAAIDPPIAAPASVPGAPPAAAPAAPGAIAALAPVAVAPQAASGALETPARELSRALERSIGQLATSAALSTLQVSLHRLISGSRRPSGPPASHCLALATARSWQADSTHTAAMSAVTAVRLHARTTAS